MKFENVPGPLIVVKLSANSNWDNAPQPQLTRLLLTIAFLALPFTGSLGFIGCQGAKPLAPAERAQPLSTVTVTRHPGEPIVFKTPAAEFDVLSSGYIQAYLLKNGERLTLDDPASAGPVETVQADSKTIIDFTFDLEHVKVSDAEGKLGPRGKKVEIVSHSAAARGLLYSC